ncbi:HigA family addiction module antitoxin [Corynebacterium glucuronolyticum]|uniref:HigA family addiction module antitoxin n=1 Tax=Corynebacterium glucuronolyticum TaxID=39791 RepID=UPI003F6E07DB
MVANPTRPAPLLPPGTYIEEWLEDNEGMTQTKLASRLGVSIKHLNQLIRGHVRISTEMATKLALVTGYSVEFWLTQQARYEARRAQIKVAEEDVAIVKSLLPTECISRLRAAGLITCTWRNPEQLILELYRLCKVASCKAIALVMKEQLTAVYRQSTAFNVKIGQQWAWLKIVKSHASKVEDIPAFDSQRLCNIVPELRALTRNDPETFVEVVRAKLHTAGVIFIAEPDISGARMGGVSFDHYGTPVIAVTDKQKREDVFWFTLFHEIAHVLNGDHDIGSVNYDNASGDRSEIEQQADQKGAEMLLPAASIACLKGPYSLEKVEQLAEHEGISPAIVVGRLQHAQKVKHSWGRKLIRRFEISQETAVSSG